MLRVLLDESSAKADSTRASNLMCSTLHRRLLALSDSGRRFPLQFLGLRCGAPCLTPLTTVSTSLLHPAVLGAPLPSEVSVSGCTVGLIQE